MCEEWVRRLLEGWVGVMVEIVKVPIFSMYAISTNVNNRV